MTSLPTLIPILLTLGFGAATIWQIHIFRLACASLEWKHVEGLVLDVHFGERRAYSDDNRNDEYADTFSANVRYRYVVAGKTFESRRLWYRAAWLPTLSDATRLLQGVRKGKPVDVYYDPANPARAVLITGSDTNNIVGIVMSIAGWIILVYLLR